MQAQFDPSAYSSFIPKKPLSSTGPAKKSHTRNVGILSLAGTGIFILSLLAAGGAFAYEKYTYSRIDSKQAELEAVRTEFQPEFIESLTRTDARLKYGEELLNQHVATTPLFFLIEESTLQKVRFTNFTFQRSGQSVRVELDGVTDSYASIALQADAFGRQPSIQNPIFSGFNVDESGDVVFHVAFTVNPTTLLYKNNITTI